MAGHNKLVAQLDNYHPKNRELWHRDVLGHNMYIIGYVNGDTLTIMRQVLYCICHVWMDADK